MKIGMLTSGGDCQGLNAALRGVAKALYSEFGSNVTIYGIRDGYRGLIEGDYHPMSPKDFSDILTLGGTILGTSRQPFKAMQIAEENEDTKLEKMLSTCKRAGLDCLVILGGNGTHKTANLLSEHGVNVVTLPKTIDNDLWGTQMTFGFQSAMDIAVQVIDSIHSTAFSHSRVFIVEVMGHKAGWLTLHAGIASGAEIWPGGAGKNNLPVFACLFLGKGAYGNVDLEDGTDVIIKQRGSSGSSDPLDQRSSVGWKSTYAAKILMPEFLVRVETCSETGWDAAAN